MATRVKYFIIFQLVMSTARWRLKSSQSLSVVSTHPTMVTQRSRSWSWMIDSHLFCSMSIGPPIPEIRLPPVFQTLILKIQGQDHEYGRRTRSHSWPSIQLIAFFPFHISQTNNSWDTLISNLTLENSRSRSKWGQRSRSHDWPSIQSMHILFVSCQSDQPFLRYDQ